MGEHDQYIEDLRFEGVPENEIQEIVAQLEYCDKHGHDWEYWSDGVWGCGTCPSTKCDR